MNENLAIDDNNRNTLGAVTNDGFEEIRRVRVNPITGAMIVEANITSTNTSIGSTIPGGTQGSVLFLGIGGTLDQDNPNFFYDPSGPFLGLGTNTPSETLDISGTAIITGDAGTSDELMGRDSGTGQLAGVMIGNGLSLSGQVLSVVGSGSGYDLIQNQGTSVTQRTTINLSNLLTAADSGGKTGITINVANLATDTTFITDLVANNSFTTSLANNSNFITTLTNNATFQTNVVNIVNASGSISINLTSQVTGILPIANGGTNSGTALSGSTIMISNGTSIIQGSTGTTTTVLHGNASGIPTYGAVSLTADTSGILPLSKGGTAANLTDPGANTLLGWDDTDNSVSFFTIGSGLNYDHSTHTLTSVAVSTPTEQWIGGANVSGHTNILLSTTSNTTGSLLFYSLFVSGSTPTIFRYAADANTSMYYSTHNVSSGSSMGGEQGVGLIVLGSFVYQFSSNNSATIHCNRFNIADLTSTTTMSFSGDNTSTNSASGAFTDGTYIYVNKGNGTFHQYSVSGTTLTFVQDITGGLASAEGCYYDSGSVYMVNSSYLVQAYTISGTSFSATTSNTFNFPLMASLSSLSFGLSLASSGIFYLAINLNNTTGSGANSYENGLLKAFSKP